MVSRGPGNRVSRSPSYARRRRSTAMPGAGASARSNSSYDCSTCRRSTNGLPFEARDILGSNHHMKLRELAERLACRLEGDGEIEIVRVAGIEDAGTGDL